MDAILVAIGLLTFLFYIVAFIVIIIAVGWVMSKLFGLTGVALIALFIVIVSVLSSL